jgi:hypothetical protein
LTLAQKVRRTVELTVLLALLLIGASVISIIGLMDYGGDRSLEVYIEQVMCISLNLVMVVIVCAGGALAAREVHEKVGSDAVLRAMYIFAIYPIILVAVVVANARAYFASLLVFGLPLFLFGAIALLWAAHVLERESEFHFWKNSHVLICYGCDRPFVSDRAEEFVVCPRCHLINRNPKHNDPDAPLPTATPSRNPYARLPEEGRVLERTRYTNDILRIWEWRDPTLERIGIGLLLICCGATLLLGVFNLAGSWHYIGEETAGAAALIAVSLIGLIALVVRPERSWRPLAIASGGMLCLLGMLALAYEGVGFPLVIASFLATYLTSLGMAHTSRPAQDGPGPRKVLYPRGRAPPEATDGPVAPATEGPGPGAVRP